MVEEFTVFTGQQKKKKKKSKKKQAQQENGLEQFGNMVDKAIKEKNIGMLIVLGFIAVLFLLVIVWVIL